VKIFTKSGLGDVKPFNCSLLIRTSYAFGDVAGMPDTSGLGLCRWASFKNAIAAIFHLKQLALKAASL
jgi:hypothetical protein